jgi:alpha-tubulin suppressor-like RCC1 family protein
VPKEVEAPEGMGPAESVACGGWHTIVVTRQGKLYTCGRGEYGRLGLGEQSSHLLLVPVEGLKVRFIYVNTTHYHHLFTSPGAVLTSTPSFVFRASL